MIAFIIALKKEAQPLLDIAKDVKQINLCDKPAYSCKLFNKDCIIAVSGIGKVSAALTTQVVIDKFLPDFIINVGTCGGTNDSVQTLKYYLVDKCCQFDFDLREIDPVPLGYIQEYDTVFFPAYTTAINGLPITTLASSDRFSSKKQDVDDINAMGASIRDMEGGAIAQVCKSNEIKYVGIKGITDVYGLGTDGEQFYQNLTTVVSGFPNVVKLVLEQI